MRMSDWSSDVCSSDLKQPQIWPARREPAAPRRRLDPDRDLGRRRSGLRADSCRSHRLPLRPFTGGLDAVSSEEHTSELQSLMRISHAVFCLTNTNTDHTLRHADN